MHLSEERRRELPLQCLRLLDQATARLMTLAARLERAPSDPEAQLLIMAEVATVGQQLYRDAREYTRLWWRVLPETTSEVA